LNSYPDQSNKIKSVLFHPATVLTIALVAAILFAIVSHLQFEGDLHDLLVYYFAPIGVPFVAYVFDRAEYRRDVRWPIDIPLVIVSFLRAVFPIPFISGHALFLSYAILTVHTRVARWTAIIILIQVAYVKLFVWHDLTLFGGIIVGALAAFASHMLKPSMLHITAPSND
jgi:hypothetical protein